MEKMGGGRLAGSTASTPSSRGSPRQVRSDTSIEEIIWQVPGPHRGIHVQENIEEHWRLVGSLLSCNQLVSPDMVLHLGSATIPTHAASIVAHSPLIRRRMDEMRAPQQRWPMHMDLSDLQARNLTVEGLGIAVTYMTTGSTTVAQDTLPKALTAASLLEVDALLKLLGERMAAMASKKPQLAYSMLEIAVHSLNELCDYRCIVVDAVAQLFPTIENDPHFLRLMPEAVSALFSSPVFISGDDSHPMDALIAWFKANPQQVYAAPFLLNSVRFNSITDQKEKEYLKSVEQVAGLSSALQTSFADRNWGKLLQEERLVMITDSTRSQTTLSPSPSAHKPHL